MFALFLAFSPVGAVKAGVVGEDWRDTSACVANSCGTTVGTKTQATYKLEWTCPTVTFSTSKQVVDVAGHWGSCPAGFSVDPNHNDKCERDYTMYAARYWQGGQWKCPNHDSDYTSTNSSLACHRDFTETRDRPWVNTTYKTETFSIDVVYGKSSDPNHCHKPTPESLNLPQWTRDDYGRFVNELDSQGLHQVVDQTRTVSCEASLIECAQSCPTECGYPGGTVHDGQGGQKTCDPTNSCSTYRWCSPDETSSTGYRARAISISTPTPDDGGKPWDSTTMINGYCYERCSVITPSYGDWGGWIVDNEDDSQLVRTRTITGYDSVDTTYVCAEKGDKEVMDRPLCQYPGVTYADDPLCAPLDDEGEVLGAEDDATKDTGVVLAATGPTDNIVVYIVELLLVAILVTYSVFFTKTYLKNSK